MMEGVKRALAPAPEVPELPAIDIPAEDFYHLLQVRRRRDTVRYVDEFGETNIGEIADYVTAQETGKSTQQITSADRKKVYVSLYQNHIPKLEKYGLLQADEGTVTPTEMTGAVAELSRLIDNASVDGDSE